MTTTTATAGAHNGGGGAGPADGHGGPPPSATLSPSSAADKACTSVSAPPTPTSGLAPLPPTSLLSRALDLPSFAAASFILYWSVPLGVLLGYIRPWAGSRRRDDALGW
jgi:hypothetical protein